MSRAIRLVPIALAVCSLAPAPAAAGVPFVRGDANHDGSIDITDPIALLDCQFLFFCRDECPAAGDADGNGRQELTDGIYILYFLFLGGDVPPPPFPWCGEDPHADGLGCQAFDACPPGPGGGLVAASDCLGHGGDGGSIQECAEYSWADGVLAVHHRNAALNCCAKVVAGVSAGGATIVIREEQTYEFGPCDCVCLFDLDLEVRGVDPGDYVIRIEIGDEDSGGRHTALEFPVDLRRQPAGSYCEDRAGYPWGG